MDHQVSPSKCSYALRLLRHLIAGSVLLCAIHAASAQDLDDLNIQFHGFVTQGFVYTNHNSWNTTDSENGSAAWNDAVVNLSLQPTSRLSIGIQGRFFLMGDYGDQVILDWAQLDYRQNDYIGFRVGDVKTPMGLYNDIQDIDPAQLWVLLPQSVYPIASRNSILDHFGAVAYGAASLPSHLGKIEYKAYGGQRVLGSNDGYFQTLRAEGITLPNGLTGPLYGATLRWLTPLRGLMLGASDVVSSPSGEIVDGPFQGTFSAVRFASTYYFAKYEHNRVLVAGEYNRIPLTAVLQLNTMPAIVDPVDERNWYVMASYRPLAKLNVGAYYSCYIDHKAAFTSARFQKDWTVAARYDFNTFLYAKAEQHFIDGTAVGFSTADNPNLQPTTRMTMFKLGASF